MAISKAVKKAHNAIDAINRAARVAEEGERFAPSTLEKLNEAHGTVEACMIANSEQTATLLSEALLGGMEFVCKLPGQYQGEGAMVFRSRKSGRVVIACLSGWISRFETLAEAAQFYGGLLSDHNKLAARILANASASLATR